MQSLSTTSTPTLASLIEKHPALQPLIIKTEGESSKWARLTCHWQELTYDNEQNKWLELNNHIFTPLLNCETLEVYLDCSKKKIYAKILVQTLIRPIIITLTSLHNLCIVFPRVCYTSAKKIFKNPTKEIRTKCLQKSVKPLKNTLYTLLYGTGMIIVSIATLIIGPLAPKTIYTSRELLGRLIARSLATYTKDIYFGTGARNYLDILSQWIVGIEDISRCFLPFRLTLNEAFQKKGFGYSDTHYQEKDKHLWNLSDLARKKIKRMRKHRNCFDFLLLDPNVPYISPSYDNKKLSCVRR